MQAKTKLLPCHFTCVIGHCHWFATHTSLSQMSACDSRVADVRKIRCTVWKSVLHQNSKKTTSKVYDWLNGLCYSHFIKSWQKLKRKRSKKYFKVCQVCVTAIDLNEERLINLVIQFVKKCIGHAAEGIQYAFRIMQGLWRQTGMTKAKEAADYLLCLMSCKMKWAERVKPHNLGNPIRYSCTLGKSVQNAIKSVCED